MLILQHEGLLEGSNGDMVAITFLVGLASKLFKGFSYNWLSREMNENLPKELDFRNEAANLEKCTRLLHKMIADRDIVIPKVYETSTRVLCMSFEEGR